MLTLLIAAGIVGSSTCTSGHQPQAATAYDQLFKEAGQAFLDDQPLPAPDAIQAESEKNCDPTALDKFEQLRQAVEQAEYVRLGRLRGEDGPRAYAKMIDYVALQLKVDPKAARQTYLDRKNRRLARDYAPGQEAKIRESLFMGILSAEMKGEIKLSERRVNKIEKKARAATAEWERVSEEAAVPASGLIAQARPILHPGPPSALADIRSAEALRIPRVATPVFRITPPPSPEPTPSAAPTPPADPPQPVARPMAVTPAASAAAPAASLRIEPDLSIGTRLAFWVAEKAEIFKGLCYRYVKSALIAAGIVDSGLKDEMGASAYKFNDFVNQSPNQRIMRMMTPPEILPLGTIVVYDKGGVCGHSEVHGHVEIIVSSIRPQRACSDGCRDITEDRAQCRSAATKAGEVKFYFPLPREPLRSS